MSIDFIKSLYYEFLSHFVPEKIQYKVEGHCNKCGKCCKEIRSYGLKNEKELKFMQFLIPWYKNFFITGVDENKNIILSCKHIQNNGLCAIYRKRPNICRNYPKNYNNIRYELIDGCGFKVSKKEFKDYL